MVSPFKSQYEARKAQFVIVVRQRVEGGVEAFPFVDLVKDLFALVLDAPAQMVLHFAFVVFYKCRFPAASVGYITDVGSEVIADKLLLLTRPDDGNNIFSRAFFAKISF